MLAWIRAHKWISIAVATLLAAGIVYRSLQPKVVVEVAQARRGDLSLRIAASGLVETESADLSFQGSGRIVGLYVREGDRVRRSAVLARLSPVGTTPGSLGAVDVIHAPYDGSVVEVYQRLGTVVSPAQPVIRMVASDGGTWVTAFVESEDAAHIVPGTSLRCRVGGYLSQSFGLTVARVGKEAVPRPDLPASSRQVRVRCRPVSPGFPLPAGTEVDVDGEVPLVADAVLVPSAAVVLQDGGALVWIVEDGRVHRREVRIGANNFDEIAIREGVEPGESVAVNGKTELEEGLRVGTKPMPPLVGVRQGGGDGG